MCAVMYTHVVCIYVSCVYFDAENELNDPNHFVTLISEVS